jgi:hypothetical protein
LFGPSADGEIAGKLNGHIHIQIHKSVYPEVSGLAAWSENSKWYYYSVQNLLSSHLISKKPKD